MALLSEKGREKRLTFLGFGEYNKANVTRFQRMAFPKDKSQWDGIYGINTDNALRHFYNVKRIFPNGEFKPEEFKCECGGRFCTGYPSYMKAVELRNLKAIREHFKKPVIVTCGLRCSGYNRSLNGSITNSLHLVGRACDINISGVTESLEQRKNAINWMRTLPNTHYVYGNGYNSNGYSVYAPYMGSGKGAAIHYDTNKAPVTKKTTEKAKAATKKESPYKSEKTIIGQACCNEYGKLYGGKPGDQTGREVCMSNWASGYGWVYMFRHKDPAKRLKIAQYAIDACKNPNIGYNASTPNRYGAWDNAEKNGHDIKNIKKKGDTTCSQLVSMVLRAIGTSKKYAPRHMDISVMTKVMPTNPDFKMYRGKAYTKSSAKLQPGDILLSSHHTAIVVKSPNAK